MNPTAEHYETLLAPIYLWMAGGFDEAVARGQAEIDAVAPGAPRGATAVDLGAGFGMHALPLARRGWKVIAVDTSAILLHELREHAAAFTITAAEDDLLSFQRHLDAKVELIVCMGDTLTHLPSVAAVEELCSRVAASLRPGGTFIATFRDYTAPKVGPERFIPVRSDNDRILTCFLEYEPAHVVVHDILHERNGLTWRQRVGAYRKLRLSAPQISAALQAHGFAVRVEPGLAGMLRVVATHP